MRKMLTALLLTALLAGCSDAPDSGAGNEPAAPGSAASGSGGGDAVGNDGRDHGTGGDGQESGGAANGGDTDDAVDVDDGAAPADSAKGFEVLADHLDTPWAIVFDGDVVYMTERGGDIVRVKDGKSTRQKLRTGQKIKEQGEGGLLGFALAGDFASARQAFVYYTYSSGGKLYNRIAVIREAEDGSGWREEKALLDRIPGSSNHDGGRLAIGPDGKLYATTGDAENGDNAQDKDSLAGKILRMNADGSVPDDNPFPGSYVYSYGHRNPQGLAWNGKGELFGSEHGPSGAPGGHDELNRIEPGGNYGWPEVIGDENKAGMTAPLYHTGESTLAPSGMAATDAGEWLVTGLRGESLVLFSPDGAAHRTLVKSEGRLRDVKIHDGSIYIITNNTDGRGTPGNTDDRLIRLTGSY